MTNSEDESVVESLQRIARALEQIAAQLSPGNTPAIETTLFDLVCDAVDILDIIKEHQNDPPCQPFQEGHEKV